MRKLYYSIQGSNSSIYKRKLTSLSKISFCSKKSNIKILHLNFQLACLKDNEKFHFNNIKACLRWWASYRLKIQVWHGPSCSALCRERRDLVAFGTWRCQSTRTPMILVHSRSNLTKAHERENNKVKSTIPRCCAGSCLDAIVLYIFIFSWFTTLLARVYAPAVSVNRRALACLWYSPGVYTGGVLKSLPIL